MEHADDVVEEAVRAGVVRLVEQAQASSAPFVRVADRVAIYFVPLTLALAAVAWALSRDPDKRYQTAAEFSDALKPFHDEMVGEALGIASVVRGLFKQ